MKTKRNIFVGLALSFITLISGQIIFGTQVFAITDPTLTINLGSLSSLDLMPGNFGSVSQSVGITTNNYTGYTVNLTNPTNSTDLINTNDNTLTIPTITLPNGVTSITENDFDSGYGISMDGTNYLPAPTSNSDGILIGSSNIAGTDSYTLTFGAKPASDTKAGIYSKTFVITAIVNHPQYSITYNANAGTDTVTDMPTNQSTITSTTGTVTLPSDVPIRSGYTFLGWDTNSAATTPTYPTGTTNTITLEPTQANAITLYAVWQSGSGPGTSEVVHPDGSRTRTTIDEYGNIFIQEISSTNVVTGYSIDTTASGGYVMTSGNNLDTELVAFDDSSSFTLHIVFKATLNQNNNKFIVTTLSKNNTYYNGFSLYVYNSNYLRTGIYKDRARSSTTGLITPNAYIGLNSSAMSGERTFDITITYDPKGYNNTYAKITASLVGGSTGSKNNTATSTDVPTNLPNATVTLGGNGIDGGDDINSITIIEFEVIKTPAS